MNLNDIMRFQALLINAADWYIARGYSIGYKQSPLGALFRFYSITQIDTYFSQDDCRLSLELLAKYCDVPITDEAMKYFWMGFETKVVSFGKVAQTNNMEDIYQIGLFLKNKYNP